MTVSYTAETGGPECRVTSRRGRRYAPSPPFAAWSSPVPLPARGTRYYGTRLNRKTSKLPSRFESKAIDLIHYHSGGIPRLINILADRSLISAYVDETRTITEQIVHEAYEAARELEKMFIDDHLFRWVPRFCDKVTEDAKLSFYREMAKLTKSFIELEKASIDEYILEASP